MARVPSAQSVVNPSVGPTVFQNIRSTPDAFGAGVAQAQASAGASLAQTGSDLSNFAIEKSLKRLERRSKQRQIELLEFSREQQAKWKRLQGEDSINADPGFREEFQTKIEEMTENLENDIEVRDFAVMSSTLQTREFGKMDNHVINQERVADETTDNALIDAQIDAIGDDPLNIDFVSDQLNIIEDIVERMFDKKGISNPSVISSAQQQATGDAIALATKRLYINNAELGQEYYDLMKKRPDLMTPQHRIDIETGLNTAFRSERVEDRAFRTLQREQEKQLREDTSDKFLQSILTTTNPQELETIRQQIIEDDILNAFGSGSKDTLIKLMEANPEGESALELDVFNRMHLPTGDARYMNKDDILVMGPRLGAKATRRLLVDWEKSNTSLGKAEKAFLDQFKSVITRSSLIGKDPVGDVNFGRFKQDVDRAIEQAEQEGIDPLTLFDNTSPNYPRIRDLWMNYKRSISEITASKIGELQGLPQIDTDSVTPAVPSTAIVPETPAADKLLRKEGESIQDYLKRRGLE